MRLLFLGDSRPQNAKPYVYSVKSNCKAEAQSRAGTLPAPTCSRVLPPEVTSILPEVTIILTFLTILSLFSRLNHALHL